MDMVMHFVNQENDAEGNLFDVRVTDNTRHTESKAQSGKNNHDKVENIYDLEGNFWEYVAEKNNSSFPFVGRGGNYSKGSDDIASRRGNNSGGGGSDRTFRPILYIMQN